MEQDWILQTRETRRKFSGATWVPLRASMNDEKGSSQESGYISEVFACGSVAFPEEHRETAEKLGWSDIGIGSNVRPYAYEDGHYSPIDQYEHYDKEPIGTHLVFEHPQPVIGGRLWILNPDLVVALRLVKEGNNWVRPEEDFTVVAREVLDDTGEHQLIEIKREFLIDYLAARNLSLRLSCYRQRVENVTDFGTSSYAELSEKQEERDDGRFELLIRELDDVYGGSWASMRVWRTDVDEEEDAPVMGPESDDNTEFEQSRGERRGLVGTRVEGEFWRDEWILHQGASVRIRGDSGQALPHFIVDTDGTRMASADLNDEDIGRWLWFRSGVVNELLGHRGFSLEWYTSETGGIRSTSGYSTHFGINSSDFVTVYAYDIARLASWEQSVWAGYNVPPDGKVSSELLAAQVSVEPASTHAVEILFYKSMQMLAAGFQKEFGVTLYLHEISEQELVNRVSRFTSEDRHSLLRLAKELIRAFSDRLNVSELRSLSNNKNKEKLGSNKLLQDILADSVGA
ncbi:MAG: hypothetical protein AAF483_18945, partial [Planctomycetota bacterium]